MDILKPRSYVPAEKSMPNTKRNRRGLGVGLAATIVAIATIWTASSTAQEFEPIQQTFTVSPATPTAEHRPASSWEPAGADSTWMSLLSNASVVKDLELIPSQLDQLKQLDQRYRTQFLKLQRSLATSGDNQQVFDQVKRSLDGLWREKSAAVSKVLLPQQKSRLKQIERRIQLEAQGMSASLATGAFAKSLALTKSQLDAIRTIEQQLAKDIAAQVQSLQKKARQRMLNELTAEQRARLEEALGDEFQPQREDWQWKQIEQD